MLRSSMAPRMNGSMPTAKAFLDQLLACDLSSNADGHARVHLRDLQFGSTLARAGALPVAADWAELFGGWTEVQVLDRYTWQSAGRLGLGYRLVLGNAQDRRGCEQRMYVDVEGGLIRSIDVLSPGCHPPVPAGSSSAAACHPSMKENGDDRYGTRLVDPARTGGWPARSPAGRPDERHGTVPAASRPPGAHCLLRSPAGVGRSVRDRSGGTPPPPAGVQAPPPRRRRRRLLLSLLSVVAVGIVGYAVSDGGDAPTPPRAPGTEVPEPTALSPLDLQPGDCYNAAPLPADGSAAPISSVEAVPCTDPHTAQVITKLGYAGQDYTDVVETRASEDCARETQALLRPEVLADPAYSFGQIHPTSLSWPRTTTIACIVVTGTPMTGSSLT